MMLLATECVFAGCELLLLLCVVVTTGCHSRPTENKTHRQQPADSRRTKTTQQQTPNITSLQNEVYIINYLNNYINNINITYKTTKNSKEIECTIHHSYAMVTMVR